MQFALILMELQVFVCKTLELHCRCHFLVNLNPIQMSFVYVYEIESILLMPHDIILLFLHENSNPSHELNVVIKKQQQKEINKINKFFIATIKVYFYFLICTSYTYPSAEMAVHRESTSTNL